MKTTIQSACLAFASMLVGLYAASLQSWDGVQIVMPGKRADGSGDKEVEKVYLFSITITSEGEEWTIFHRYNDFIVLKKELGTEAEVIAAAPFPGKYLWPWPTESMKEERRIGLEKWLQQVVARAKIIDAWREPLKKFLHKDAEIGAYERDKWLTLLGTVNENVQSSWDTTASKLGEWYESGVASCEGNDNCKALGGKLADMKSGVVEMAANIVSKTAEIKECVKEAMALNDEAEQARADLKKVKDSAESNAEEVKAAEDKLNEAEGKANKKMMEVEVLKEDVQELEQSAKATMENSFESTIVSADL